MSDRKTTLLILTALAAAWFSIGCEPRRPLSPQDHLRGAIILTFPEGVREAIEQGADVNAKDSVGRTPLLLLMDGYHRDYVERRLERSRTSDAEWERRRLGRSREADDPEWERRQRDRRAIVRILLDANAYHRFLEDNHGFTALRYALLVEDREILGMLDEPTPAPRNVNERTRRIP